MSQPDYAHSFTKIFRKSSYNTIDSRRPELSAQGKCVVISGGHSGIGYAIAEGFAAAGAALVVLLGRRETVLQDAKDKLQSAYPSTEFAIFAASITDSAKLDEVFSQIRAISEPNILVTCAAYFAPRADAVRTPMRELEALFGTNIIGNLNLVHAFLEIDAIGRDTQAAPENPNQEKIILDVSSSTTCVFMPGTSAYAASKLAFTRLMSAAQTEAILSSPSQRLRIHYFHPGNILTKAVRDAGFDETVYPWEDAELAGNFAVWLASPEAEFLKGRFVWSNWDAQELLDRKNEIETQDLLKIGVIGKAEWPVVHERGQKGEVG